MLLALDCGNTHMLGGVFRDGELLFKFRKSSRNQSTSDEIGIFLKSIMRENNVNLGEIRKFAVCSVVPDITYSACQSAVKYFSLEPFVLRPGVKTGLNLKYKNPSEIGADRIANAIGAFALYGNKNMIVVDMGTATTFCIISAQKEYLGGMIMPGIKISMESLARETAKLPRVEIIKPEKMEGKTTIDAIQCGLYYSNYHAIKGICAEIKKAYFPERSVISIGTGGYSKIFEGENLFNHVNQELVLWGINAAVQMNMEAKK